MAKQEQPFPPMPVFVIIKPFFWHGSKRLFLFCHRFLRTYEIFEAGEIVGISLSLCMEGKVGWGSRDNWAKATVS
jgi:hypothetical protein